MVTVAVAGGYFYGLPGVLCGPLASIIAIIYIWKPYYLFSRGFNLSVFKYWRIFAINILATAIAYGGTTYFFKAFIQDNIPTNNWLGLIISGAIYTVIITTTTTVAYYTISAGFRDFVHRSKLFKKIIK